LTVEQGDAYKKIGKKELLVEEEWDEEERIFTWRSFGRPRSQGEKKKPNLAKGINKVRGNKNRCPYGSILTGRRHGKSGLNSWGIKPKPRADKSTV
jgi:hypothetical protein